MGALRCWPPIEPWKGASPKEKIPPSLATSQPGRGRRGHADDGGVQEAFSHRALEGRVAETEDPAVAGHEPVPRRSRTTPCRRPASSDAGRPSSSRWGRRRTRRSLHRWRPASSPGRWATRPCRRWGRSGAAHPSSPCRARRRTRRCRRPMPRASSSLPVGAAAIPTTGAASGLPPIDPSNGALNEKTPPSKPAIQ